MSADKKRYFLLSSILLIILSLSLFFSFKELKIVLALFLLGYSFLVYFTIKKRKIISINKMQVLVLVSIISLIYIMIIYLLGLKHGFYKTLYPLNIKNSIYYLIPSLIIIISFEIIRFVFVSQQNKLVSFLTYIAGIIVDVLLISSITSVKSFNQFMDLFGITFLPAILSNYLYHNLSKNYGIYPNIIFRLVTTLYIYLIPIVPNIPDSLLAIFRLFTPLLVLGFIKILFEKEKKTALQRKPWLLNITTGLSVAFMVMVAMLFSCQFRYGAIVIATESMTGEINKGDIIIYEQYKGGELEEGQIILFKADNKIIVHRIVEIKDVDGQIRYYTKGDANNSNDKLYRVSGDIIGYTNVKVPYLGYFTLWLRDMFD